MNILSKYTLLILIIIFVGGYIHSTKYENKEPYNFVELQMRYKHYTVKDKYQPNENTYVLCLVNPITRDEYKVYIADYLYMNVYFVGDTIK